MTQPATAPVASRASASCGSVEAVPQTATSTAASRLDDRDGAKFAEAVGHRAGDELNGAVGERIGGDHDGGGADGRLEIVGDLRQQRIGYAHLRLGGKARPPPAAGSSALAIFCAEAGGCD